MRPGLRNTVWMVQRGQAPPKREKGTASLAKRLDTLPAWSTRMRKNGTPRAPGRDRVVRRCATCSKLIPNRAFSSEVS